MSFPPKECHNQTGVSVHPRECRHKIGVSFPENICQNSTHRWKYPPTSNSCNFSTFPAFLSFLREAYEVGCDFAIAPEQQKQQKESQPHPNHAASHTGEDPSCLLTS